MLHPLARITSAYRFNLGWDALTGGLLTRMFPQGCSPCIRIVVISSTCLAMSYLLWYVIFTLGLWPWLVLYVVSCTSVFLFLNAPMWANPLSREVYFHLTRFWVCYALGDNFWEFTLGSLKRGSEHLFWSVSLRRLSHSPMAEHTEGLYSIYETVIISLHWMSFKPRQHFDHMSVVALCMLW